MLGRTRQANHLVQRNGIHKAPVVDRVRTRPQIHYPAQHRHQLAPAITCVLSIDLYVYHPHLPRFKQGPQAFQDMAFAPFHVNFHKAQRDTFGQP